MKTTTILLKVLLALLPILLCMTLCGTLAACRGDEQFEDHGSDKNPENEDNGADTPSTEGMMTLTNHQLWDKMAGSWVAQMIGVTWSASTEFRYNGIIIPEDEVPEWKPEMVNDAFGQDDLYVEVPFLDAMKDYGYNATIDQIAPYFRDSKFGLAHANYQGRLNLQLGIEPSLAGHYRHNYHADDIDWQIEADFLGNIFPGMPSLAAERAFEIGHLMNYGDGVYGGVFVSAMHAAAFMTDDLNTVIEIGIQSIPEGTKFRAVVDQVMDCYEEGITWQECWQEIEDCWAADDKCPEFQGVSNIDAKINAAYILIGLLWGEGDFTDTIVISMRCGQDSDCNPSSAAAILGTMYGLSGLPEEYTSAVDYDGRTFAYTDYTLEDCIAINLALAKGALSATGATVEGDVWSLPVKCGVTPVPFEQWPDDELTVYMNVTTRNTGEVLLQTACVPPEGYSTGEVSYTFDMGDGSMLDAQISSYKYLAAGVYTIKCTAMVDGYTATVEREVDMSDMKGQTGFKVTASCSETNPQGGGSRDISVICDGSLPTPQDSDFLQQYDTYGGSAPAKDWFALTFDHTVTVSEVLFTEGAHFENGGWFQKTPTIEVLVNGEWKEVAATCSPLYIEVNAQSSQGDPYQTFTFTLEQEIACEGVRVVGTPGGSAQFVSCAELDVNFTHVENPTYEETDLSDPVESAIIIVSESNPVGAGCKDIEIMRDGIVPDTGASHETAQYDTFVNSPNDHEEYYGYVFRGEAEVESVTFTEGTHFGNGGWFKDGTMTLELLIDGEWREANYTLSPKYPSGDSMGNFGSNYQSYTFALDEAVSCRGIRVIGMAGGSAHFTSVSELAVQTTCSKP